jgi:hypothetical protein
MQPPMQLQIHHAMATVGTMTAENVSVSAKGAKERENTVSESASDMEIVGKFQQKRATSRNRVSNIKIAIAKYILTQHWNLKGFCIDLCHVSQENK